MISQEQVKQRLRDNQSYLSTEYGVTKMGLFGSYSKDTADEDRDIDIIVELDRPLGFQFVDLAEYLEQLLGKKINLLTPVGIQSIRVKSVAEHARASMVYIY
jgi:predicted nucleotidyltransferase